MTDLPCDCEPSDDTLYVTGGGITARIAMPPDIQFVYGIPVSPDPVEAAPEPAPVVVRNMGANPFAFDSFAHAQRCTEGWWAHRRRA